MKPYVNNRKRANNKRAILLVVFLLLLAGLAFAGYRLNNRNSAKPANTESAGETINYAPGTDEEKAQTDKHKEDLANQQNQTPPPTGGDKKVMPIITDATQYEDKVEVRAYIPSLIENGGKCIYTFRKDSAQVIRTVDAQAGPQTTQCESIGILASEFPVKGTWVLTVSYSSASSNGSSDAQNVEVK